MPAVTSPPEQAKTNTKPKKSKEVKPKYRFQLLRGRHIDKVNGVNVAYQVERDPTSKEVIQPIFESEKELDKLFNSPGKTPKFRRLGDEVTVVDVNPMERKPGETIQQWMARLSNLQEQIKAGLKSKVEEIDTLDKDELEAYAATEEIDISAAKNVNQMRKLIKDYLSTAPIAADEGED